MERLSGSEDLHTTGPRKWSLANQVPSGADVTHLHVLWSGGLINRILIFMRDQDQSRVRKIRIDHSMG